VSLQLLLSYPRVLQQIAAFSGAQSVPWLQFLLSISKSNWERAAIKLLLDYSSGSSAQSYQYIQELFCLYSARTKSVTCIHGIGVYETTTAKEAVIKDDLLVTPQKGKRNAADSIGYLVFIPVPWRDTYQVGGDRDPLSLIEAYIWAAAPLDPLYDADNYGWSDAVQFAQKKIRIILALNRQNDPYDLSMRTASVQHHMQQSADALNVICRRMDVPATVLPMVWGLVGNEKLPDNVDYTDMLRSYLSCIPERKKRIALPFPFATVRAAMLESAVCARMLSSLYGLHKTVYYVSGDADLVSFNQPGIAPLAYMEARLLRCKERPARAGGGVGFANDDIAYQLQRLAIDHIHMGASVLMTQLCHWVDFYAREDLAKLSVHLPYYSEIHTYIRADVLSEDKVYTHSSPIGRMRSDNPVIANDGGDYMPHITRVLRAQKEQVQVLRVAEESALQTAARHELVAVVGSDSLVPGSGGLRGKFNYIQYLIGESFNLYSIKSVLIGLKNMQLTPSQLNRRFLHSGLLSTNITFHHIMQYIDVSTYPFCVFFLTRDSVPKDAGSTAACVARIQGAHHYLRVFVDKKRAVKATENEDFIALYKQVVSGFYTVWKNRIDMKPFTVSEAERVRLSDCRLGESMLPVMQLFWRLERKLRIMVLFTMRILSLDIGYPEVPVPQVVTISSQLKQWKSRMATPSPEVDELAAALGADLVLTS